MKTRTRTAWVLTLLAGLTVAIAPIAMTGCETVKGVGRDIEDAGEKLDDAIDDE